MRSKALFSIIAPPMKTMKTLSVAALLLASLAANGEQISGRELLAFCADSAGSPARRYCNGYITAAVETHATWALWGRLEPVFCFPKGDKFGHAFGAVVAYLKAHPNELNYEASSLVLNSLNKAFPCVVEDEDD